MAVRPPIGPDWAWSPKDWGAKVNYDAWTDRFTPDDGIALHHGGSGDYPAAKEPYTADKETEQLRRWERYHLSRGWRGLGYGWAVGKTGNVYRARGWGQYGAHRGDVDGDGITNNTEIIPVIFIMSGLTKYPKPNQAMLDSFQRLRLWLEEKSGRELWLYGHVEVQGGTSCPGPNILEFIRDNRKSSDYKTVDPVDPPTEEEIVLKKGAEGAAVVEFQEALQAWAAAIGLPDPLPVWGADGDFGPETESAVMLVQGAYDLPATGIIDGVTAALLSVYMLDPITIDRIGSISAEAFAASKNAASALNVADKAHGRLDAVKGVL
jgi:hypothetical protein